MRLRESLLVQSQKLFILRAQQKHGFDLLERLCGLLQSAVRVDQLLQGPKVSKPVVRGRENLYQLDQRQHMGRIGLEDFIVRFDGPFGFASRDEQGYQAIQAEAGAIIISCGYVGATHRENQGKAAFVLGDDRLEGFQRAFKISRSNVNLGQELEQRRIVRRDLQRFLQLL